MKIYHVTVGFADEIVGDIRSHWSIACYKYSREFYDTATIEEPENRNQELWRDWILSITKLIRYVDVITENCIETADDYYDRLKIYYDIWVDTPEIIGFNALYHMGKCYDYIEDADWLLR